MNLILATLIFALSAATVNGHGRLVDPPSRNAMWRYGHPNPPNYRDNELNCGGFSYQWNNNGGKCGICGDPFGKPQPHVFPGKFANNIIVRTYRQGQVIHAKVEITANHKGFFTFKIGDIGTPPVTEDKLDHALQIAGTTGTRYYLPVGSGSGIFDVMLQLPASLTCAHCVLRWWYNAGNSWGTDSTGSGVGKGAQETFVNCADIKIVGDNGVTKPTTQPQPSTTTKSATKVTFPQTTVKTTSPVRSTTRKTTTAATTKAAATTTIKSGDACRATGRFAGIRGYDWWCKMNCPINCPKSHCICSSVTGSSMPKPKTCKAAGAYVSVPGMGTWCRQNCPAFCPKTHCVCS